MEGDTRLLVVARKCETGDAQRQAAQKKSYQSALHG
jgi:hypothetical protein